MEMMEGRKEGQREQAVLLGRKDYIKLSTLHIDLYFLLFLMKIMKNPPLTDRIVEGRRCKGGGESNKQDMRQGLALWWCCVI